MKSLMKIAPGKKQATLYADHLKKSAGTFYLTSEIETLIVNINHHNSHVISVVDDILQNHPHIKKISWQATVLNLS